MLYWIWNYGFYEVKVCRFKKLIFKWFGEVTDVLKNQIELMAIDDS